jgi:hypothetical protein
MFLQGDEKPQPGIRIPRLGGCPVLDTGKYGLEEKFLC